LKKDSCVIVEQLVVTFKVKGLAGANDRLIAVNNVSFDLNRGETVALIGESGSGKTTVGRVIVGLTKPTKGIVKFITKDGREIKLVDRWPRKVQRYLQLIFQDPFSSLNPRMKVFQIIAEGMINYGICERRELLKRCIQLLEMVGLEEGFLKRYPHEMSGGERQRIAIARALSVEPEVVVCDEVVSALDVSTQVAILKLLKDLQQRLGLSYLFITHDLYAARYLSDRALVMYRGHILEEGQLDDIVSRPAHPYTQNLIKAAMNIEAERIEEQRVEDGRTDLCPFRHRCRYRVQMCDTRFPERVYLSPHHSVTCHLYSKGVISGDK